MTEALHFCAGPVPCLEAYETSQTDTHGIGSARSLRLKNSSQIMKRGPIYGQNRQCPFTAAAQGLGSPSVDWFNPSIAHQVFMQVIPEGAGTVKTHGWLFFRLFASFLILAGASK